MSNPSIRIRFIRANGSAKNDDNVVICRLGARQFNLSYTYGESATKNPHHVVLTDSSVFRWMRNLIGILEKDVDPFEYIQMDLPFMPSVLFDAAKLGDAYHAMLSALEFHLDNWPTVAIAAAASAPVFNAPASAPGSSPVNTGFAEAEAEDDEDYSDMPELIPNDDCCNHHHHYPTRQAVRTHHMFLD